MLPQIDVWGDQTSRWILLKQTANNVVQKILDLLPRWGARWVGWAQGEQRVCILWQTFLVLVHSAAPSLLTVFTPTHSSPTWCLCSLTETPDPPIEAGSKNPLADMKSVAVAICEEISSLQVRVLVQKAGRGIPTWHTPAVVDCLPGLTSGSHPLTSLTLPQPAPMSIADLRQGDL